MRDEPVIIQGDGTQTRDFIHVQDVVQANLLAMMRDVCGTYNIASGIATRVDELAQILGRITGVTKEPVYADPRPGDVHDSYADIRRARDHLRFTPGRTLEQGLADTVASFTVDSL
jgi:Nucleoside-diphosphate-sugar epimerases